MKDLTVGMLIESIRRATSLLELKRLVGPSVDDLAAEQLRTVIIRQMKRLHGPEFTNWPFDATSDYRRLLSEQEAFETTFGLGRRAPADSSADLSQ